MCAIAQHEGVEGVEEVIAIPPLRSGELGREKNHDDPDSDRSFQDQVAGLGEKVAHGFLSLVLLYLQGGGYSATVVFGSIEERRAKRKGNFKWCQYFTRKTRLSSGLMWRRRPDEGGR